MDDRQGQASMGTGRRQRHENEHDEDGQHVGDGSGFWTGDMEQSILAAVEGLDVPRGIHRGESGEVGMDIDQEDVPSARAFEGGGDEMEMRRVFGLPADTDPDNHHDDGHDNQ